MARTKTTAREVAGQTKELVAGIRKSPRATQSERGVAKQSKERTTGPSRVPIIERDNASVHKPNIDRLKMSFMGMRRRQTIGKRRRRAKQGDNRRTF